MSAVEELSGWRRILGLYRTFGGYLAPYRGRTTAAYLFLAASTAFALLRPWPLKLVLDHVILRRKSLQEQVPWLPSALDGWSPATLLAVLAAVLVLITLLENVAGYWQKLLFARVGHGATTDVLEDLYFHLQTLPRGSGLTRTGDVIVRLTSDVRTMRDLLVEHVQKLGNYAFTVLSTVAVMAWLNWQLTLIGLLVVPAIYFVSQRLSAQIRSAAREKRGREGAVASTVQETLHSLTLIQAFAQEEQERQRFRAEAQQSFEANVETSRLGGALNRSIAILNAFGIALVLWYGGRHVLDGTLSPGDLVIFIAYIQELYKPIQSLSELSVRFVESTISGERVLELLQTTPRVRDHAWAVPAPPLRGDIVFDEVTFGYQSGQPVLRGLSLRIKAGQKVAFVGGSGAGKSTLLNLLLRFQDPWQGHITVDSHDLRRLRLHSLRKQISVVLQESALFRRTVRENISFGCPGAHLRDVERAARAAHAHDFIMHLPQGYNTLLDEAGGNLSGGQRQRLALARAFLRNAPILVLDEPTSALDAVTEAELSVTLQELTRSKTTIVIAHRLSTVQDADVIFVLEQGVIVQQGTHQELVGQPGLYRTMFESQTTEDSAVK